MYNTENLNTNICSPTFKNNSLSIQTSTAYLAPYRGWVSRSNEISFITFILKIEIQTMKTLTLKITDTCYKFSSLFSFVWLFENSICNKRNIEISFLVYIMNKYRIFVNSFHEMLFLLFRLCFTEKNVFSRLSGKKYALACYSCFDLNSGCIQLCWAAFF